MAGQQFQYDDSGNTFFYFLTSFVGLIVIPATYYLWPRDQNAGECCRQLPADQCRPRQPLRAAPPPPSPTQPPSVGVIQPASRPSFAFEASAAGGARARRCFPRFLSGPLSIPVSLSFQEFRFAPSHPLFWALLAASSCLFVFSASDFIGYFSIWREQDGMGRMGIGR